jgi:hypothetical protein
MRIESDNSPLNPKGKIGAVNQTQDEEGSTMNIEDDELEQLKRRKRIKYAIIGGGVALGILILTLVLVLTLGGGSTPPPGPKPDPPGP